MPKSTLSRRMHFTGAWLVVLLIAGLAFPSIALADDGSSDLAEMSLEDLLNVEVTSVSKRTERLSDAAAAIYVLTGKDIQKAGARTIADALRLVPGLHVANIDANTWAVSSRGFNGNFANKLLVLVDGRTVYSTLFSGVWWDAQDLVLDNIDRIEVIRGPGATLWGANAVNGVINIITKPAQETQGGYFELGGGTEDKGAGALQYATPVGSSGAVRFYAKSFDRDTYGNSAGLQAEDDWSISRGGFRYDVDLDSRQSLSVRGDAYSGKAHAQYQVPEIAAPYSRILNEETDIAGGHTTVEYRRNYGEKSYVGFQAYFDYGERSDKIISTIMRTFDAELRHAHSLSESLQLIWGVGFRSYSDVFAGGNYIALTPERRKYNLSNAFVQVDFDLIPTVLGVTIGSKIEHHELTDYELQPNVRIMWHPRENHSVWAAVSRAVRTPSRGERDGIIFAAAIPPLSLANPTASTLRVQFEGEDSGTSESVVAFELGWRSTIARNLTVDIATFYNSYSNLINGSYGQPTPDANFPAYLVLPITIQFDRSNESYGFELSAIMTPIHSVTTRVGYTYLWTDTWTDNSGTIGSAASFESPGPRHQVNVHTTYDLNHDMSLASTVRYVDDIPSASIDSYMELDLHASYRIYQGLELFVTGNDLLAKQHLEYRSEMLRTSSEVQRRVFTGINWRF